MTCSQALNKAKEDRSKVGARPVSTRESFYVYQGENVLNQWKWIGPEDAPSLAQWEEEWETVEIGSKGLLFTLNAPEGFACELGVIGEESKP